MKFKLFFLLCIFAFKTNAQEKPYPTRSLTLEWLANFKNITSKEEKIKTIISKIYSDTLYRKIDFIILDTKIRDSSRHICKTMIFVTAFGKYYKIDLLENPKLKSALEMFTIDNFTDLKILENPENTIAFGTEGLCGVVIMETKTKKLVRKLKLYQNK